MPKRSERRDYVKDQIKGYLAGRPLTSTELIEKIKLPEGYDANVVHSCLHDLKAKGELAYSLNDKLYSLANGAPAPPCGTATAATPAGTPPPARDKYYRPPSRFGGPIKQETPDPAPGKAEKGAKASNHVRKMDTRTADDLAAAADTVGKTEHVAGTRIEVRFNMTIGPAELEDLGEDAGEVLRAIAILMRYEGRLSQ